MELELIQNIRELTQRTAEDFDCFFEQADIWTNPISPKYAPQSFGWEKEEKMSFNKSEANKVQKIFFYLETKEEESDTSHAP